MKFAVARFVRLFLVGFWLGCLTLSARVAAVAQSLTLSEGLPDAPGFTAGFQAVQTQGSGIISGVVLNINGEPVPGATVILQEEGRSEERTATSGEDGRFLFTGLFAGKFHATIHAAGLESFVSPEITLRAGEHHEMQHISLPIAATSTDVQVTVTQEEIAQEQLHAQEQQRVFGVLPNFYTSYIWDAAPLTAKQKFGLALKSITDPIDFVVTGAVAGVQQAADIYHDYHQGVEGYAKRYGASYADGAIARMIGSAVLPSILHQDPRYFFQGTATKKSRAWHAISSAVITRQDSGALRPNYSHIGGGFIGGAISNLYHPAANRGVGLTLRNGGIEIAGNALNNLIREFLLRQLTPKVPDYATGKPADQQR
jgi:hypothetical protein